MKDEVTERVIGAAIEVHRVLGPGLLESIYEEAQCTEFSLRNIFYERQKAEKQIAEGAQLLEHDEVMARIRGKINAAKA